MATRAGVHPTVYVYTRTDAQLAADTGAWIQSWAFPASMMLGGTRGSGRSTPSKPTSPQRRKWDWLPASRHAPGTRVDRHFVDFDEWDRPETVGRLEAAMAGAVNRKQQIQRFAAGQVVHPAHRR